MPAKGIGGSFGGGSATAEPATTTPSALAHVEMPGILETGGLPDVERQKFVVLST